MDGDFISCTPGNPYRKPMWRWNRAAFLNANKTRPTYPEVDDAWVTSAAAHLDELHSRTDSGSYRPTQHDLAISVADRLRTDAFAERRWRLEALVLAGEPVEAIARQCGLATPVVEAYEALFFDVREGLAARDWITLQALYGMEPQRLRRAAPASLWRVAGYAGGRAVLEVMIAVTMSRPLPPGCTRRPPADFADESGYEYGLRRSCEKWIAILTAEMPSDVAAIREEMMVAVERDPQAAGEQFERFKRSCEMLLLAAGVPGSPSTEPSPARASRRTANAKRQATTNSPWASK